MGGAGVAVGGAGVAVGATGVGADVGVGGTGVGGGRHRSEWRRRQYGRWCRPTAGERKQRDARYEREFLHLNLRHASRGRGG